MTLRCDITQYWVGTLTIEDEGEGDGGSNNGNNSSIIIIITVIIKVNDSVLSQKQMIDDFIIWWRKITLCWHSPWPPRVSLLCVTAVCSPTCTNGRRCVNTDLTKNINECSCQTTGGGNACLIGMYAEVDL